MNKKTKTILIVAIAAVVVWFLFFRKKAEVGTTAADGTQGNAISFENSKGFTEAQVSKLQEKLREWIKYIISQNWDSVKNKNAEKLVTDSLYQISLAAKKNPDTYANIDFNTWEDLKQVAEETGIYSVELEYAKTALI